MEKILGIIHTENIHVTAEAYDIALDIIPGNSDFDLNPGPSGCEVIMINIK